MNVVLGQGKDPRNVEQKDPNLQAKAKESISDLVLPPLPNLNSFEKQV